MTVFEPVTQWIESHPEAAKLYAGLAFAIVTGGLVFFNRVYKPKPKDDETPPPTTGGVQFQSGSVDTGGGPVVQVDGDIRARGDIHIGDPENHRTIRAQSTRYKICHDKICHNQLAEKNETLAENANADYTVWFGTDREPIVKHNRLTGFVFRRDGNIHFGKCRVFVPKGHLIGSTGSPWWKRLGRDDDRLKLLGMRSLEEDGFWSSLGQELQWDAKGRKLGLSIFTATTIRLKRLFLRAAQIGFDLGICSSMAMFSWPSMGKAQGYPHDEECITASEENLHTFLKSFAEKTGVEKIHIIAHSMGNRLFMRCIQLASFDKYSPLSKALGQAILAAPDVYAEVFGTHADKYVALCDGVTIYSSARDLAVMLSSFFHSGDRVGYHPPVAVYSGIDTVCVTDVSIDLLGHGYYASSRPLLSDIKSIIFQETKPHFRMGLQQNHAEQPSFWKFAK